MTKIIHQHIRLECNPTEAFQYFTVNKLVEQWLVKPYNGSHTNIEPKLGGKYEIFWDPKNPDKLSTRGCKITAIEPGKLLAFDWRGPEQFPFMNDKERLTHVVVAFLPVNNGPRTETDVYLVHSGWGSSGEWDESREWFEKS